MLKYWNHPICVNISPTVVNDAWLKRSWRVLQHGNPKIFFSKKAEIRFWLVFLVYNPYVHCQISSLTKNTTGTICPLDNEILTLNLSRHYLESEKLGELAYLWKCCGIRLYGNEITLISFPLVMETLVVVIYCSWGTPWELSRLCWLFVYESNGIVINYNCLNISSIKLEDRCFELFFRGC